jgi:short subunit dehydrogenase-like uncharacterized protein
MNDQKYDIIIFGATSFVGQIMTRYIKQKFNDNSLSWAIAGRSKEKLKKLTKEINASEIETIVADANDENAINAMCNRAKVVVSTVGPYALYGSTLVKVCAETGTHYCDLTGEPQWIRKMQDKYEKLAKKNGAWIVNCCGFDSIPSDLGVHFLQQKALKKTGQNCNKINMRVLKMKGGASGGTIASIINLLKEASRDSKLRKELKNPYSLCPPSHNFTLFQSNIKVSYDEEYENWVAPFIMAAINSRVIHRSNALSGNSYGTDFLYEEAVLMGKGNIGKWKAHSINIGLASVMAGLIIPPTRWLLQNYILPKPGEGPSKKEQLSGEYELLFTGTTSDGTKVKCRITGDQDPGYGSTAKMLAQSAICLAKDVPKNTKGGFWTPATIMGDKLTKRLITHAGLDFEIIGP